MKTDRKLLEQDIQVLLNKYAIGTEEKQQLLKSFILSAVLYNWDDPEPEEIIPLKEGLDEIRHSLRMFKKYKYNFKISIFGSARTPIDDPLYKITYDFAKIAASEDLKIITGAGPGIMEAGNKGAGPENSFGLGLNLPFENSNEIFENYPEHLTTFRHFFSRKLTFYRESQAVVVMPGGFGTMDEIFQGLVSMHTGKISIRPIVLMDRPGGNFWNNFHKWVLDNLEKNKYILADDVSFYKILFDPVETLNHIKNFYKNFFSYFMINNLLFLQLKTKLSSSQLKNLNKNLDKQHFSEFVYVRERYFNYGTLYVYSTQKKDSYNFSCIKQIIDYINTF